MNPARLLLATRSADKLREIRRILDPDGRLELVNLDDAGVAETDEEDGLEVFATFEENALAKARFFAASTGLPTLADDSGLCVDALGGAPGVLSKRFCGRSDLRGSALDEANNRLLLRKLDGLDPPRRSAHYVCAIALVVPPAEELHFRGRCDGVILPEPRGHGGFGYDPLFLLPELGATFGELPPEEKNRLSHRAEAVRQARAAIHRLVAGSG